MHGLIERLADFFFELTPDEVYVLQSGRYANMKVVAHLTKIYMVIMFVFALIVGFCCQSLYDESASRTIAKAFVLTTIPLVLLATILAALYPHLRRLHIPTFWRGVYIGIAATVGLALGYQRFETLTFFLYFVPLLGVPCTLWIVAAFSRYILMRE